MKITYIFYKKVQILYNILPILSIIVHSIIETFNIYIDDCIPTKTYHLNDREPPYL